MPEQLKLNTKIEKAESRWWDPRVKGTLGSFAVRSALVAGLLTVGAKQVVDHSKGAVDSVVGNRTEQIRQDIQGPMSNVQANAESAKEKVDNIDGNVQELKRWFEDNVGVTFDDSQPGAN